MNCVLFNSNWTQNKNISPGKFLSTSTTRALPSLKISEMLYMYCIKILLKSLSLEAAVGVWKGIIESLLEQQNFKIN